jgi:hypothetical protein
MRKPAEPGSGSEVLEAGGDPVEDRSDLFAGREDVRGGSDSVLACERQDSRRVLAPHELGPAKVQVRDAGDRFPRRVVRVVWRSRR